MFCFPWLLSAKPQESDEELLNVDFCSLSNECVAWRVNAVDESVAGLLLSAVSLWGLRFPRGRAGVHRELGRHLLHVRGLHHLLFARLHQRGQEEKPREVNFNNNLLLSVEVLHFTSWKAPCGETIKLCLWSLILSQMHVERPGALTRCSYCFWSYWFVKWAEPGSWKKDILGNQKGFG